MKNKRLKVEPHTYKSTYLYLSSGDEDYPGCDLVWCIWKWRLTLRLPQWLLQPYRVKVFPKGWDAATVARLGRDWYWHITERQYGVSFHDGMMSIYHGRQTMDSNTEQRWGWSIPWLQWRHVRYSLYNLKGAHYWTAQQMPKGYAMDGYELLELKVQRLPKKVFAFFDFDGEAIEATAYIEEREWRAGDKWCKWLSWFRKPLIRRSLDLHFNKETGQKKGSWKGGTIGHSIEMLPGELHEAAFRRYCAEHRMRFHLEVATLPPSDGTKQGQQVVQP